MPPDVLDIAYVEVGGKGILRAVAPRRRQSPGGGRDSAGGAAADRGGAACRCAKPPRPARAGRSTRPRQPPRWQRRRPPRPTPRQRPPRRCARPRLLPPATAEVQAQIEDLRGRRVAVPAGLNIDLISLDAARLSVAGPDSIYLTGIGYGNGTFAARMRYLGGNQGILEAPVRCQRGADPERGPVPPRPWRW